MGAILLAQAAHANPPQTGAQLVFLEPHPIHRNFTAAKIYTWDSKQWTYTDLATLGQSPSWITRIVPLPGLPGEFAFLSLNDVRISGRPTGKIPVQAFGVSASGAPILLTDSNQILSYFSARQRQIHYTNPPQKAPPWGKEKPTAITQLEGGEFILAQDGKITSIDFSPTDPTRMTFVSTVNLNFWPVTPSFLNTSGQNDQIAKVLTLMPHNKKEVWAHVTTQRGFQAIILVNPNNGHVIDGIPLDPNTPYFQVQLLSSDAKSLTYREGNALRTREVLGSTTFEDRDFFSPTQLMKLGVPRGIFFQATAMAWLFNWGGLQSQKDTASIKPPAEAPIVPTASTSAPPPTNAARIEQVSATLLQMPPALTRKEFLRFYRDASPGFRAVVRSLLSSEAEITLLQLGFARYHTTLECIGNEDTRITRQDIFEALMRTQDCADALRS